MGYLIIGDVNATKANKHAQGKGELMKKFVRTLRKFHFSLMVLPGAAWLILFFYIPVLGIS